MVSNTQQIPAGYKQTDVGVIPNSWKTLQIRDIAKYRRGSFPQPYGLPQWYDEIGGKPFIQVVDVGDNCKLKKTTKQKLSKKAEKYSVFVKKGSVIITIQGSIGRVAVTDYDAYMDRTLLLFESFKVPVDVHFIKYALQVLFEKEKQSAPGGIIKTITKEALSSFVLQIPPKKEQEKISVALSDIDSLISKLDQLIQKKKNIKQGAMQEMLTGKRRLPGVSGEWVDTSLGSVVDIRKGQLITSSTIKHGNVPVIAGGKTPAYFHNKANRLGKTITISASGASAGYVWIHLSAIFASDCSTIEESSNYSIGFIYYWLKLMQEEIYYLQTGGAQPHIHPSDLNPMPILIPSIEEQIAVEQVLSEMDAEIDNLVDKKLKYQDLKQGMMQQLLTGKIRLI